MELLKKSCPSIVLMLIVRVGRDDVGFDVLTLVWPIAPKYSPSSRNRLKKRPDGGRTCTK